MLRAFRLALLLVGLFGFNRIAVAQAGCSLSEHRYEDELVSFCYPSDWERANVARDAAAKKEGLTFAPPARNGGRIGFVALNFLDLATLRQRRPLEYKQDPQRAMVEWARDVLIPSQWMSRFPAATPRSSFISGVEVGVLDLRDLSNAHVADVVSLTTARVGDTMVVLLDTTVRYDIRDAESMAFSRQLMAIKRSLQLKPAPAARVGGGAEQARPQRDDPCIKESSFPEPYEDDRLIMCLPAGTEIRNEKALPHTTRVTTFRMSSGGIQDIASMTLYYLNLSQFDGSVRERWEDWVLAWSLIELDPIDRQALASATKNDFDVIEIGGREVVRMEFLVGSVKRGVHRVMVFGTVVAPVVLIQRIKLPEGPGLAAALRNLPIQLKTATNPPRSTTSYPDSTPSRVVNREPADLCAAYGLSAGDAAPALGRWEYSYAPSFVGPAGSLLGYLTLDGSGTYDWRIEYTGRSASGDWRLATTGHYAACRGGGDGIALAFAPTKVEASGTPARETLDELGLPTDRPSIINVTFVTYPLVYMNGEGPKGRRWSMLRQSR
jgi:hypothetical protein